MANLAQKPKPTGFRGADPRLNLPRFTRVSYGALVGRVGARELDPNRRPGIGRVSYWFERAVVMPDGTERYSFAPVLVAASKLAVRA